MLISLLGFESSRETWSFFSHPRVSCVAFLLLIVLDLLNFQTLLLTLLVKETKLGSLTIPSVQTVTPKVRDRWTFLKVIFASIFWMFVRYSCSYMWKKTLWSLLNPMVSRSPVHIQSLYDNFIKTLRKTFKLCLISYWQHQKNFNLKTR